MTTCNSTNQIVLNCSGQAGTGSLLSTYWAQNDCLGAYGQELNTLPGNILGYNNDAQPTVQGCVDDLFTTYLNTNTLTDNVTSPQYSPFQETLIALCANETLPGICTQFLTSYCAGFTRTEVTNSPVLTDLCGCYTPPNPNYLSITNNPACDPLCHNVSTSQQLDSSGTGALQKCSQNVCVIDNEVVNAVNSRSANGVNFTNICSNCNTNSNAGCLCIVAGVSVADTLSSIGIGDNIQQFCDGTGSVCITEDAEGNIITSGPCTNTGTITVPDQNFYPNIYITVVVVVFLLIVIVVIFAM